MITDVAVSRAGLPRQAYGLRVSRDSGINIQSADSDGTFYAAMTLAQLPERVNGKWVLPCVDISDAPALKWRVLSDDVSRGPLPNMRYFKERIRTIAAFKMNGYSPYMEHVFVDPRNPLPAPLDGITPAQLRELSAYAKRYHVTFIPEQQTFAHMHNTLAVEKYATAAEFQHDFLLSPAVPLSLEYLTQLIRDEARRHSASGIFSHRVGRNVGLGTRPKQAAGRATRPESRVCRSCTSDESHHRAVGRAYHALG